VASKIDGGQRDKGKSVETAKGWVSFVAAIVALMTALVNLYMTIQQEEEIQSQQEMIQAQQKQLDDLARILSLDVSIDRPGDGETLPSVYDAMEGSISSSVPPDHELRVVARDRHNYFLVHPPPQVAHTARTWSQTDVRLNSPGDWQLALCLANEHASAWLDERARRNDWSGFPQLPEGMVILRSVNVRCCLPP
jgi:hypothetical protein